MPLVAGMRGEGDVLEVEVGLTARRIVQSRGRQSLASASQYYILVTALRCKGQDFPLAGSKCGVSL